MVAEGGGGGGVEVGEGWGWNDVDCGIVVDMIKRTGENGREQKEIDGEGKKRIDEKKMRRGKDIFREDDQEIRNTKKPGETKQG